MPKTKKLKTDGASRLMEPTRSPDEEIDEVKTKERPIEIPEDDEKVVDPDLAVEDPLAVEEDAASEEAGLDDEEIDPFGDKWEQ